MGRLVSIIRGAGVALLFLLVFSSNAALQTSLGEQLDKRAAATLKMLEAAARPGSRPRNLGRGRATWVAVARPGS